MARSGTAKRKKSTRRQIFPEVHRGSSSQQSGRPSTLAPEQQVSAEGPLASLENLDLAIDEDEANPAASSGRGRKRNKTQATEAIRTFDNDTAENQHKAFVFTARVDVAVRDPFWAIGLGANRPLIPGHVDDLVDSYRKHG